ncbi:protein FAR1-RELATED SEQUENCE 2-like [Nicotiana tomentosiformis]|uniref:protein FAR1-RELATED SEQUENCE 2-like n=1 Tax=Nicotiana tomentosiformis TaxID=4098 RepID=UPI00388CD1D8
MTSDDSLLNEYEWVDVDSHSSFNNVVYLDDDDEEPDGEYYGEANDDEEQFLGNELELYDVDQEMENDFNEEDVIVGPISGMRYRENNFLFAFYKEHARLKGFSFVKRNSNKKGGDTAKYITYYYDRATICKTKFTTKSNNCKVRLVVVLDDSGYWRVSKFIHDQNHDLLPSISRLMARHRSVCDSLKRYLVAHDRSGIRPSKNIRLAEVKDREFFYSINVIILVGCKMCYGCIHTVKAAYEQFRDAICFDTTYKLVFRTGLEAIGNVHPDAIITDQCRSIKTTIAEVMPHTIHSCVRPSKIARGEFESMVLDSITVEVFEKKWTEYIAKYNLHTKNWFNKLYYEKEK